MKATCFHHVSTVFKSWRRENAAGTAVSPSTVTSRGLPHGLPPSGKPTVLGSPDRQQPQPNEDPSPGGAVASVPTGSLGSTRPLTATRPELSPLPDGRADTHTCERGRTQSPAPTCHPRVTPLTDATGHLPTAVCPPSPAVLRPSSPWSPAFCAPVVFFLWFVSFVFVPVETGSP